MDKIALLLLLMCITFFSHVSANGQSSSYEATYAEIGYKTVEEAWREAEQHFNETIKLPLQIPPISFTHQFGRLNDLEGEINDDFEMVLINEQLSEHHYKINVRPLTSKLPFEQKEDLKTFQLADGTTAYYLEIAGFNVLVFEKDNWQYRLSVDRRVSHIVQSEMLVDIANSIDYKMKTK